MRVVVQRVKKASVTVNGEIVGEIGQGLLLLVGIKKDDTEEEAAFVANKISNLRIFEDSEQKMNVSAKNQQAEILSISQFTLYGDTRRGNRPSFGEAAPGPEAKPLYDLFNQALIEQGFKVETGVFGADMDVALINDGPVTLIVEK